MRTNHLQYRYELSFHEKSSSSLNLHSFTSAHTIVHCAPPVLCILSAHEHPLLLNLNNCSLLTDVSEDDIKLVMEQAQVNRAQAIKALQDHGYEATPPVRFSAALLCFIF